ncbi:VTC domain-containing protein [Suillus spraguei]|nr:VTC domain-containing protein [Suillus spraguei]
MKDYLEERPFCKYNWVLIAKLSKLYDLVRSTGHPVQGDSSEYLCASDNKVHLDNLVPLKLAILRYLPVLVFNAEKEFEPKDAAITLIYFDDENLEPYLGRLERTMGVEAICLRWYGDMDVKTIFIERKTHREDWTGEKSVKACFPIKEHLALVDKGKKTQAEVDSMIQLASEIQYRILTKQLHSGDPRVRISLDTELTMAREDNWDGQTRTGDNWRRTDIGINPSFNRVSEEDKEPFKYGVLEVGEERSQAFKCNFTTYIEHHRCSVHV